jgi:hypothetical protein
MWRVVVAWLFIFCGGGVLAAERVALIWDPSPSPGITNYQVYYGTNQRSYAYTTNAGLARTQRVVLPHSGRWYFAATCHDSYGLESDFSKEATYESKPVPPVLLGETWLRIAPVFGVSSNLSAWVSLTGNATWFPATNRAEFFRVKAFTLERALVP